MLWLKNSGHEKVYILSTDVMLAQGIDHFVRVLVKMNRQFVWMERYCTLKAFIRLLPEKQVLRISKFYAVNTQRVSGFEPSGRQLTFDSAFTVTLGHRIEKYMCDILLAEINVK